MSDQRKTLGILRIEVLSYQAHMNLDYFEALVVILVFERLPKEIQELLTGIMLAPVEAASVGEEMATEGATPKVVSVEVTAEVPKSQRFPKPKPIPPKEGPKMKKDKQKATQLVHESPMKHQKKEKPTAQEQAKVVDLEPDEDIEDIGVGVGDVDVEGEDPISKIPPYVPPCQRKVKDPNDIDENKITLFTSLLPDKITFEGPCLACIPLLQLKDWDLVDIECFPT